RAHFILLPVWSRSGSYPKSRSMNSPQGRGVGRCVRMGQDEPVQLVGGIIGWRVQQDGQRRHVFRFHVAVDEEALAIFGDIVGKEVGGGNWSPAVNLEEG